MKVPLQPPFSVHYFATKTASFTYGYQCSECNKQEKLKKSSFKLKPCTRLIFCKKIYFQNISTFHLYRGASMFIPRLLLEIMSQLFDFNRREREHEKHPSRGVLSKRCFENIHQIYRTPMLKCNSNKAAKQLCWNHISA